MATLAEARQAYADALAAVTGGTVQARGGLHSAGQGDGWVTAPRLLDGPRFDSSWLAELSAVIVAGGTATDADAYMDQVGASLITGLTDSPVSGVQVEPVELQVQLTDGQTGSLYVLLVTCTYDPC